MECHRGRPEALNQAREREMTAIDTVALNKEVVRRLYAAIQHNSPEDFSNLVADKHIDHSNGRNGPAGFVGAAENLHRAYSNLSIQLETLVAEDDWVLAQWQETGVHSGQFFNLKPTNKPFESQGLNLYRLADGQITDSWIAVDPRTIRAQQQAQRELQH
jgi:predicted ester cyclase